MFSNQRASYKTSVVRALPRPRHAEPTWTGSSIPTLDNPAALLQPALAAACPHWRTALLDNSDISALDGAHGNWEPVVDRLARNTAQTIPAKSMAFTQHIITLGSAKGTRIKAWRNWKTVLTWAAGQHALDRILPMDATTLQAMLWDFTSLGASNSMLKSFVDAVISRHRDARLPSPVSGHLGYRRLTQCLARVVGRPQKTKFGITRQMVVDLLRCPAKDTVSLRNHLVTVTLTIGCMRPSEGAMAQTCDLVFDSDYMLGLTQYLGCSTLTTLSRKQDQIRKGHGMRFGKSADPKLDINHQLGLLQDLLGTRPRPSCTKKSRPGARCTACPPLFPKLDKGPHGSWTLAASPTPSASLISSMVLAALRDIGVNTSAFTGASCRMGGLTIATEAGVPESIMWMQSGHSQDRAARRYVRLTNPDRLYDTWRAFNL